MDDIHGTVDEMCKKHIQLAKSTKDVVYHLRVGANKLDMVWKECQKGKVVSTTTSVVGGLFTVGAGIATLCTAGVAAPLLAVGISLTAGGAAGNIAAMVIEAVVNSDEIKIMNRRLKEHQQLADSFKDYINKLLAGKDAAEILFAVYAMSQMAGIKCIQSLVTKCASKLPHSLGNLMKPYGQAVKVACGVADDVAVGAAQTGAKTAGKALIGVGAVFLVWDTINLAMDIRDLVKEKGSEAGNVLRRKASQLEEHLDMICCRCY
jgi:hypothetical protein